MEATNTGGPAFPCMPPQDTAAGSAVGYPHPDSGMTLRDYFAARAMVVYATENYAHGRDTGDGCEWTDEDIAVWAYKLADAMIKARAT